MPVLELKRDEFGLSELLEPEQAFGAMIVEGMVMQHLRIARHAAMRLLGPGDLLSLNFGPGAPLLVESRYVAPIETRLAILGNELLMAGHRWPRLLAGLHARLSDQAERVAAQLVVCQLPRVADRLLAILWLLSESWGRVTPFGVDLPLALTHDNLGALIGARRPTVTLALKELTGRGAIVRQERGWLLLEQLERSPVVAMSA
ncbi:MAG: Crp/Fnr family transcriptional regulator [Solirubrobacterales bacterium]|nr:Crp/Fnr family transcriptional regulator [Solirubrobacterales bacterium]